MYILSFLCDKILISKLPCLSRLKNGRGGGNRIITSSKISANIAHIFIVLQGDVNMKRSYKFFASLTLFTLLLAGCNSGGSSKESSSSRGDEGSNPPMTEDTYTITWKNWNGTTLETDNNVKKGTTPTYDGATPTRPDDTEYTYTWSGWDPEVVPATANQTYTATYSYERLTTTYTINFDLNGGTSASYSGSKIVEQFSRDIFFFDCVKEGWNFRGWSYNGTKIFDEKGNQLANPTMAKTMTFVAMYAQTARLTIVSNMEGAGNITGEGEYPYNTYVDVSAHAKQGYEFVGWYYENTLLSNTNEYKYMMWSEDVTLEARFKLASFLMNVHSNNKDYGLVLLKSTLNTNYLPEYQEYRDYTTAVTIAAYSKTDVRFLGWYDTENKLVETNAVYSFAMPNYDYSLEAKWNYFTISYALNGGTNNFSNPTSYTIDSNKIPLHEPTKTGYDFVGWTYNGKTVTEVDPSWIENVTLVANWTGKLNKLSVTSEDASKGTVAITSGSGYSDESITVVATPVGDCVFKGWYNESTKVSDETSYTFIMPVNDYSLVAHFFTKEEELRRLGGIPTLSDDGKTIVYGLYPQKNVNDSSLVSVLNELTTPESNGWYLYEGDYYAKVGASPYSTSYKFDNGTFITSGTTYWFKCEPIVWNVLSNANGEYYIVSSVLLDAHCYYNSDSIRTIDGQTVYPNNYEYSDIRAWLNEDFYNSAFALDNSHIQTTVVDNSASTTGNSSNEYACSNTEDKVFLLSYEDYKNSSYGLNWGARCCKTTDWARARGAYSNTDLPSYLCNGNYWTRSPYKSPNFVCIVGNDGSLDSLFYVYVSHYSARPALTIKIA